MVHLLNKDKALNDNKNYLSGLLTIPQLTIDGRAIIDGFGAIGQFIVREKVREICQIAFGSKPIPEYMKEGRLMIMSKTKEPVVELKDMRPLIVYAEDTKLLEQALLHNLMDLADEHGVRPLLSLDEEY